MKNFQFPSLLCNTRSTTVSKPTGNLNEMLDDLRPLCNVLLLTDFSDDPKHLVIRQLQSTTTHHRDIT